MCNESSGRIGSSAFYSVADSAAFLGVVALLNSLRLIGHKEPFFLLDCGLTDEQQALLAPQVTLVAAPPEGHPTMLKSLLPLSRSADVMALLDADVIVVRPLGQLLAAAGEGRVVLFENDIDRQPTEWADLLGLTPLPRRRYVNAGHLFIPADPGLVLLRELDRAASRLELRRTIVRGGAPRGRSPDDPFFYTDQDVLNAILSTVIAPNAIDVVSVGLAAYAPFRGVRCDPATLRCRNADGTEPYLLHHILRKPWLSALPDSVYSVLLRRLLNADDVVVRVPAHLIPLRLRSGRLARADQKRASWQAFIRDHTRGRLGIRARWEARLAQSGSTGQNRSP